MKLSKCTIAFQSNFFNHLHINWNFAIPQITFGILWWRKLKRCDDILCEMRHVGQKYNPLIPNGVCHQTLHIDINRWILIQNLVWQFIMKCICWFVSQYNIQLQPAASLVAIPTCKPTIGNKSRRAMITELMILDVTFITFMDATISEHFICGLMEPNLK
jgi:hypothetical protein